MAHLSLYRKFRPDTFDKMVRQEHVVRILKNQIEGNAVGHAYLFCGPRGTGKTSVARIFARAINCEHPVNGSPCGVCPVCKALAAGSLDIAEIDAASNNGVAEMRDLREKVQYPPVTGRYKVYIIDEVHMLTDSAFNALLKTLEEPPAHAVFILATTEPHKIPATILSRCMRLDFKLIPQEDLEKHLKSILREIGKPYEDAAVSAIARAGAGSDRDMLSVAETCIAYSHKLTYESVTAALGAADFRETCALADALLRADGGAALAKTEQILAEGKSVGVLCRDILQLLNQISVAKLCKNAETLLSLPAELFRTVADIAARADGKAILRATEVFAKAETELRYVSSPRICLEAAVMRVSVPETDYDIDALLARVKRLEERLSAAPAGAPAAPISKPPADEEQPSAPAEPSYEEYPEEEPVFEEAYFSDGPLSEPERAPAQEASAAPISKPPVQEAPQKSVPAPVAPSQESAEVVFGKFMRLLRRTSKNGVLFTMCSDLEAKYEGETLALYTQVETISRMLSSEAHRAVMAEIFAQLGVADFAVKYAKAPREEDKSGLEQLKRDFRDYPVEIK